MRHATGKCEAAGNTNVMVTERGSTFGYGRLVVDMTGFRELSETGRPVVFDATHSVQLPGGVDGKTGGDRRHVPALTRAAVATGEVDGIFLEVHPEPSRAKSDAGSQLPLAGFSELLTGLVRSRELFLELES